MARKVMPVLLVIAIFVLPALACASSTSPANPVGRIRVCYDVEVQSGGEYTFTLSQLETGGGVTVYPSDVPGVNIVDTETGRVFTRPMTIIGDYLSLAAVRNNTIVASIVFRKTCDAGGEVRLVRQ